MENYSSGNPMTFLSRPRGARSATKLSTKEYCSVSPTVPHKRRWVCGASSRHAQLETGANITMEVIIVGGGIGGLTLALMLQQAGIACRVYEAAPEIRVVGVGINILPHATKEYCTLGLEDALANVGIATKDACFFNRFGQLIYREPIGRNAGYDWPQFSIH